MSEIVAAAHKVCIDYRKETFDECAPKCSVMEEVAYGGVSI
jgi:hypothetical protein